MTLLPVAPNTHKKKILSDGQCGAPPSKVGRIMMGPQDFVNCVQAFMAATLSKSSESIAPLKIAESVLARYKSKVSGPKNPKTCSQAEETEVVETTQPAPEKLSEIESEPKNKTPSSMSEEPTAGPSRGKAVKSSKQLGKGYDPKSHKSIIEKDPLPKPRYEQKSRGSLSYGPSPCSFKCGSYYGPGLYCEQLRDLRGILITAASRV